MSRVHLTAARLQTFPGKNHLKKYSAPKFYLANQDEFSDEALAAVGLELVAEACRVARQAVQCDEVADLRGLDDSLRWLRESAREKRTQMRAMRAAVNVQRRSIPDSVK